MTACSTYSWGMPMPSSFYRASSALVKAVIEPEYFEGLTSSLITTECANSVRTTLTEEIDAIYNECIQDDWVNNKKEQSYAMNPNSVMQAKEFASYIKDIVQPYVVPYTNGCIGFEWNINDKLISIMFKSEGSYAYSIITDTINAYGENKQNSKNQQDLFQQISNILTEGNV